jgi:putative salt-induced outer membrane protein
MPARLLAYALATATVVAGPQATAVQQAADLPPALAAMIDAALASGDQAEADAVIRTAKRALPQSAEAIDRRVAQWRAAPMPPVAVVGETTPTPPTPKPADAAAIQTVSAPMWSGEGEAGAFVNTGNAPGIGLVGGFKMLVEGENWRVGTNARAEYQETAGLVTREQYRFSAEPNYKFDERGYLFGLGQYEQDRFQGFKSRYSVSGGLGYSVIKSDAAQLSVKAGPAWRVTEPVTAERESVVAGLASFEAKVKLTPSLQYSQDASIYSDATGSTFYTLAALDSKLIGKLKARLSYMVQHETAPELGRLGTDTTSRLTLVYGF